MQLLQSFVEQFTYLGVYLVLLAGSLGLPIPEEMAIIAAGVMSHEGLMAPWPGLLVCLLGVLSGDVCLYWTGRNAPLGCSSPPPARVASRARTAGTP